ncbi:mucoidy inhibitor MuiA family protein [Rhodoblastus acidophilus]|uniref:Mucoidy inhibitor MuiA family protein n=1 Tax=Candidatus Rhodoblastus alkanivorans TaxID=2954117 RepID=A0ABS9ZA86_9HYPH|nr:mucoidy inhibitor MuiA family protein [Candidatus Rhodoblastus alkanivorans]MCI4677191.1 mucoidy inhibitor MuiA family protein [Candidatus Rhodoblastus alkanivorans]MCI4684544.1 mucoidy inhibitor MuiA family protein [Candidatus Rhodoblastus alkanivorans]MDI4641865.1 mucoidy inhibitor MuiA family protein [Rhodoblastus acidophilus]
MRQILPFALSLSALCAAVPAMAAEVDVASHLDAVTLYPDGASVTRVAEIDLPAGDSRLIFRNLPAGIDPAALRVRGQGDTRFTLGAVDLRKAPAARGESDFDKEMKSLRNERAAAQVKIDALAAKLDMIRLYGQTGPDKIGDEGLKPENWSAAWDALGAAMAKTGEDLRAERAAAEAVDLKIEALAAARPAPAPGGAARDVAVGLTAGSAGKVRLAVTYRVASARWTPAYEARLTTAGKDGGPRLELTRRAIVSQATGEDWNGVTLTIAAFRATGAASAPEVVPRIIAFYEPPVPVAAMAKARDAMRQAPTAPAPMRVEAETAQARMNAGAYQTTFVAPGRVTVPSGVSTANIALSTATPQADLSWRISPALDPRAFLSVHYVNGEEAPLLPGSAALYRDGELIGQARLPLVAPHEGGDLGFGVDERVTVRRQPVNRKENEPSWFGRTKTETREFRTVLRNLHDFPVHAIVTDQTPYSEDAAISVETLARTTPPSEKDPDGKRGLLRWRIDLAPGQDKDIVLAYRMKWPADREVIVPGP